MASATKALVFGCLCACAAWSAVAQAPLMPYQEYAKRIQSAQAVGPLSSDLFGESISLYNGATEFAVTDIDLSGNDALPVRLGRRLTVTSKKDLEVLGGFGAWDMEVPYIHGTFIDAWQGPSGTGQRCSIFERPLGSGAFEAADFWSGTKMYIPSQGDQDILRIGNLDGLFAKMKAPADGHTYRLGTKGLHRLRCKSATANGFPGEAFIAVDANGTTMTFDHALQRHAGVIEKPGSDHGNDRLGRTEIYLMLTRMEDRFGNWVSYQWSGDQLLSITASDGRAISLAWNGRNIVSATAHGRTWQYRYGLNGFSLQVVLPDNSSWGYEDPGVPWPNYPSSDFSTSDARCLEPFEAYGPYWLRMTHPSGATARFDFQYTRHRRTGIPESACVHYSTVLDTGEMLHAMAFPDYFDVYSVMSKTISGPGLATQQWTYEYEIPAYGRVHMDPWTPLPCTNCQEEKSVWVNQPDGTQMEYRFGTLWHGNDGRLLATYTRRADRQIVRAEISQYLTSNEASTMPFPDTYGASLSSDDASTNRIRPVGTRTIAQDGAIAEPAYYEPPPPPSPPPPCGNCELPPPRDCDPVAEFCVDPMGTSPAAGFAGMSSVELSPPASVFTRHINAFDEFARPTQVVRSSSLGHAATDTREYHDDLGRWVLGQVKRTTTDVVETSRTEFDARSLPWKTYSFGKLQQTLTYHLPGNIATVADGGGKATMLSDWFRGVPRSIRYADDTTQSAVVGPSGLISQVTDQNGFQSSYTYDPMGRLTGITYPVGDSTVWAPTSLSFQPVAVDEHGIPAGHWRQTVSTGNARKLTYFDALWRPLLTHGYDAADIAGTQRFQQNTYDPAGRVSFASYPGSTSSPSTGVWTEYDALGRVTSVSQDSEHGPLITRTAYLPGLRTQVTNPRGFVTTTQFQAWDEPGYDLPVRVDSPESASTLIVRDFLGKPLEVTRGASVP